MNTIKVVIVGAGFAGLNAAKKLATHKNIEITLIDRRNHHLFQPLLYQVATAGLSPSDIATPIRSLFVNYQNVKVILEEVMRSKGPAVVMLWGAHAQKSESDLALWAKAYQKDVLLLSANHPSPLSALRGEHPFMGCGHFGLAQRWLAQRGLEMDWRLS